MVHRTHTDMQCRRGGREGGRGGGGKGYTTPGPAAQRGPRDQGGPRERPSPGPNLALNGHADVMNVTSATNESRLVIYIIMLYEAAVTF